MWEKETGWSAININIKAHLIWTAVLHNFSAQIAAFDCSNILGGYKQFDFRKVVIQFRYNLILVSCLVLGG